jgi:limonene-1,2-epoxide hydrolase
MKEFQAENAKRNQGFFTTIGPEEILTMLTQKMADKNQEFTVSEKEWKLNFQIK